MTSQKQKSRVRSREIARAHRVLLGREPTKEEAATLHTSERSLREIAAEIAGNDEHARYLARDPLSERDALAGSEAAARLVPPGTISADERAIAGEHGYMFIYRGSNSTFRQFAGEAPLEPRQLEQWEAALDLRTAGAEHLGARLASLIIPDKLAVLADAFPETLAPVGPRPVEQMLTAIPGRLLYPANELRSAGEIDEVAYRTDSHLSLFGAKVVYGATMAQLGLEPAAAALECEYREVLRSSALGRGFSPRLHDVQDIVDPTASAEVESNEGEVGLHRGIVRISRNPEAEHKARIVVIGDSYLFPWRSGQIGCLIERSFSEAHFLWTAMGWDSGYLERVDPDYVLLQTAERFVIRPPELDSNFKVSGVKRLAPRGLGSGSPPSTIEFAQTAVAVADRLSAYKARVDRTVADGDEMFAGNLDDYLSVTHSALAQIGHAMIACGLTSFSRILDLPCGHGRVMRGLQAAFPEAELTGCDINRDGVDFCAQRFGAVAVYSDPDPAKIPLEGTFDLIWVGSLLTHLDANGCRAFLKLFRTHLSEGGLLLASSHGRNAVRRWRKDDERAAAIAREFHETDFGYRDHSGVSGYGTSAFTAAWIADAVSEWTDLMLVGYVERGLADHQDLIAILKMDVHHPQNEFLLT